MYFSAPDLASQIFHPRNPLQLSPSAAAVPLPKNRCAPNGASGRDDLDLGNLTDDLEISHAEMVPDSATPV
jgi:hypothetical protein